MAVGSVFIENFQSPGDICMLTSAVRDLKKSYPNIRINVNTSADYLWENNPYIDRALSKSSADVIVRAEYPLIHKSNSHPFHFIHGFRLFLSKELGLTIGCGPACVDIHFSEKELAGESNAVPGLPESYWVVNAGFKDDFTAKGWEFTRYAEVVSRLSGSIAFVQVGDSRHNHQVIPGALNLIDMTSKRKILTTIYRASGVLTGVSYPMHLSTMPTSKASTTQIGRVLRPCVCIAGGREPVMWIQQPNMHCIHTVGMLPCCSHGGCWKSRTVPLHDNSPHDLSLCAYPVTAESGQIIPKCMDMISTDLVVDVISKLDEVHHVQL